jgi:predicted amidohydrolase
MTGLLQKDSGKLLSSIQLQETDRVFAACSSLAKRHQLFLHLGSTAVRMPETDETGKAANRGALFGPDGRLLATYDKIHMFNVDVDADNRWRESNRYQAGKTARVVTLDVTKGAPVKLGMSICYDMRFPHLYRKQAQSGAQILTAPSCFTQPTGEAHWEVLLRARAIENGAFMIAAAQSGEHEDGRKTHGHSIIIDPWGKTLGKIGREAPEILVCDIDLDAVRLARKRIPSLANGAEFTISEV